MSESGVNMANFDSTYYVNMYPDLQQATQGMSGDQKHQFLVSHFMNHGQAEKRKFRMTSGGQCCQGCGNNDGPGVYCGGLTIPPQEQRRQIKSGFVSDPDYRPEFIPSDPPVLPAGAKNFAKCKWDPFHLTAAEQKKILKSTFIEDPDYQ